MKRRIPIILLLCMAAVALVVIVSGPRREPDRSVGEEARERPGRPQAALKGYQVPNRETTGVPDGWIPRETRAEHQTVTEPGAVVQDILFENGASIIVRAPDVTIRRVDLQGGIVTNQSGNACVSGLRIEDSTFEPEEGQPFGRNSLPVIGEGGYTAERVEIWKRGEGFRASICTPPGA